MPAVDLGTTEFTDLTEIGRGAFGVVYRARQDAFRRVVAIKVIDGADEQVLRRFERERHALGQVSAHPSIAHVYAAGITPAGRPFMAMEFAERGSLADRLLREGPLPWQQVVRLGVRLAGALETAHRIGILHRDVKPANVLVTAFGEPRLADFGIALLAGGEQTRPGFVTGSISYTAPEVLDGQRPTAQADVYGLGATLYALLAGRAPFARDDEQSILPQLARVLSEPVPDLRDRGVPDALAATLERALAKRPDARYATAADLGRALQAVESAAGAPPTEMVVPDDLPRRPADGQEPDNAGLRRTAQGAVPDGRAAGIPRNASEGVARSTKPITADERQAAMAASLAGPLPGDDERLPATVPLGPPTGQAAAASTERGTAGRRRGLLAIAAGLVLLGGAIAAAVLLADPAPLPMGRDPAATSQPVAVGEWAPLRDTPIARQQVPAAMTQGTLWVPGGLIEQDGRIGATATVTGYEPAIDRWKAAPDLPLALHHQMAASWQGELVVLGGWSPQGSRLSAVTSGAVFVLRGGAWEELPPLLQPRAAGAATAVGDLLIVTGGQDADGALLVTTEVFDGEAWREVAPLPTPREHLATATDGRLLYAVGGRELSSDHNLATVEAYDPAADVWQTLADLPTARGGLGAAVVSGRLVAVGGEAPTDVFAEVEAMDLATGRWEALASMRTPRHGLAVGALGAAVYAAGGALAPTHAAPTATLEVLDIVPEGG